MRCHAVCNETPVPIRFALAWYVNAYEEIGASLVDRAIKMSVPWLFSSSHHMPLSSKSKSKHVEARL